MFQLLASKRFGPFFLTQSLGAFNDNVYKNSLAILIAFQSGDLLAGQADQLINLSAFLFILPFFLFSATAGQLADKFERSHLIRMIKLLEIVIMIMASIGFYLNSLVILLSTLFLMGSQSTFFGPIKYSIIPQHLSQEELVAGNALVETGTFLSILIGTLLAAMLMTLGDQAITAVTATILATASLGYLVSWKIPLAPAPCPNLKLNLNPFTETLSNFRFIRKDPIILNSVVGISWFWFFGATFLTQIPQFSKLYLGGGESSVGVLLALFSIGIAIGSFACEKLSHQQVEIGLVPFGSIGLSIFGLDLFFASPHLPAMSLSTLSEFIHHPQLLRVFIDLFLLGVFGGFYIVPLYALIQERGSKEHIARIIAGNNILNSFFMVASALLAMLMLGNGASIPQLFAVTAILNIVVAIYIYTLVPEFLMRFITWVLIHLIYRVRVKGLEEIPQQGAAIVVCNHVSFVDALIILGSIRRPVRFVMYHKIFAIPILSWIFRSVKSISIAPRKENAELLVKAYEDIHEGLQQGDIICVFPEGSITADGKIHDFKPGVEKMISRDPVNVIPMALSGLWGSLFSRKDKHLIDRRPRKLWARITLNIGRAIPAEQVSAQQLQQQVIQLKKDHEHTK